MSERSEVRRMLDRLVPPRVGRWARRHHLRAWPPVGTARFTGLRRLRPISQEFGFERGTPIDRFYIEQFLARQAARGDIRGRVLEIKEDLYASRLGGGRVDAVEILDIDAANPKATIVADLAAPAALPPNAFDSVICTQTLHFIYDFQAALVNLHASLKPGGVLLLTVPGISRSCTGAEAEADYWRFSVASTRRVLEELFQATDIEVEAYGNVLTSAAFLYGLAAEELNATELKFQDDRYEAVVALRAVKPR